MSSIPANFTDGVFTLTDDNSNSEQLLLGLGTTQISGLVPDGRELEVYQSQGAVTGARKGARVFPTITVNAQLAGPSVAFHKLALGVTATFTSTTVDIGDYPTNDCDFSFDYGSEARDITADDLALTGFEVQEGSPSTVQMTFQILGPYRMDGQTYISAR